MKMIISIPDDVANKPLENNLDFTHTMLLALMTGIRLPDNPTNGDMIKAIFQLIEEKREISSKSDNIIVRDDSFLGIINRFHTDWRNAPFRWKQE